MKFKTTKYSVGQHFLSALINGDTTGLEASEELALDRFVREETNGIAHHWDFPFAVDYSASFERCEVTGLMSDCATVTLHQPV